MNARTLGLTPLQLKYLNFIKEYYGDHDYAPTQQEMADHFECTVSNVSQKMRELKARNYIDYEPGQARSIIVKE